MTRFWKIVIAVFALVLIAGILLAGVGYLTGASVERIAEVVFGGWSGIMELLESLQAQLMI